MGTGLVVRPAVAMTRSILIHCGFYLTNRVEF